MILKKHIKFIIFNEDFWGKGLIYSQNFLPLLKLYKDNDFKGKIKIYAFISLLDLILFKKDIFLCKNEFKQNGIKILLFPILFVRSRLFILKWFMFPLLILTTFPYLLIISLIDLFFQSKEVVYHLRAYVSTFLYVKFYFGSGNLVFDPRSDFIIENRRLNHWKKNSLTDRLWLHIEKEIILKANKVIFISQPHLEDTLTRSKIDFDVSKYVVYPNPIDFSQFIDAFNIDRKEQFPKFLYTGSLGNWNDLNTYLGFFKKVKEIVPEATMLVLTSTRKSKINDVINKPIFKEVIGDVDFHFNVPYDQLPKLYAKCNIGLQLMEKEDSRIGVKFVEYLAAGLVPVVNKNVKGAAKISMEKGIGFVIEDDFDFETVVLEIMSMYKGDFKSEILKNKHVFDVNQSYKNLIEIYG